jgi:hypothetical protein
MSDRRRFTARIAALTTFTNPFNRLQVPAVTLADVRQVDTGAAVPDQQLLQGSWSSGMRVGDKLDFEARLENGKVRRISKAEILEIAR